MPLVDIDSVGVVEFPDSMSAEEINAAGEQIYTQARRATPALQPQGLEQPLALPQDTGVGRQMQNWLNPAPLPRVDSDAAQQVARTYEAAISQAQDSNRRDSIPKLQEEYRAAMQSLGVTPLSSPEASLMDPLVSLRDRMPSAQTVQDAMQVLGAAGAATAGGQSMARPETLEAAQSALAGPQEQPGAVAQGTAGALRSVAGAGEFLTSPLGVATLGSAAAPKWAQKLITMGFTMDMLRHTPELADRFGAATVSGDAQAQVETLGDLLLNSAFVVSGAKHSLPGAAPAVPPVIKVEMSRRLAAQLLDAQLEGAQRPPPVPRVENVAAAERPGVVRGDFQALPVGEKAESGKVGGGESGKGVPPPIEDLPPVEQKSMRAKQAPEVKAEAVKELPAVVAEIEQKYGAGPQPVVPAAEPLEAQARASNILERGAKYSKVPEELTAILDGAQGLPNESRVANAVAFNKATPEATFEKAVANPRLREMVPDSYIENLRQQRAKTAPKAKAAGGKVGEGKSGQRHRFNVTPLMEALAGQKVESLNQWVRGLPDDVLTALNDRQAEWVNRQERETIAETSDLRRPMVAMLNEGQHQQVALAGEVGRRQKQVATAPSVEQKAIVPSESPKTVPELYKEYQAAADARERKEIEIGGLPHRRPSSFPGRTNIEKTAAMNAALGTAKRELAALQEVETNARRAWQRGLAKDRPQPPAPANPVGPVNPVEKSVAKVAEHVEAVASGRKKATPEPDLSTTTGPRAAKEIKSELVQRLEEAIEKAPDKPDSLLTVERELAQLQDWINRGLTSELAFTKRASARADLPAAQALWKRYGFTLAKNLQAKETGNLLKAVEESLRNQLNSLDKITIEIPGDGTFRIPNTKPHLQAVLAKSKRLSTSTEPPKGYTESMPTRAQGEMWAKEAAVPAESSVNTGALGKSGMGGAKATEFEPGGTATSIRNATVDVERQQRGLPPAMEPLKRSFGQVWDEAMARLDQDPGRAERLVAELKEKPRAVSDLEDALLLHRQVELQNRYARYTRELAQAYDDARSFPNRLAEVEEFKALVAEVSDQLLDLYNVSKLVGTETSRGLNARKMLAQEDFTLASMELAKREANGGAPLTEAQRAELVAAHEKIAALEKAFNEAQARAEEALAGRRAAEAVAELEKKAAAANKVEYDPRVLRIAEEIVSKLERKAVDASARLREKLSRMNTGVDPTLLYDFGVVGAAKIARFGLDKAKLIEAMVKEFGEKVREWENEIWTVSNERLEAEGSKYGDKAEPVKRLLRRQDELQRQENIVAAIRKAAADKEPMALLGDYVRKLAESLLRSGVKGREALVTAVHDVLKAEFDPNITRREAMDAISGYGNFRSLNPDAIKAELRDLKGQMQQVAKLEDIQARQPLPKSGVERRVPSDEERRLIQQVNEAKRRFGVVVSDPARQLKSALDAVKTRLKNQIADIEFQIATKARTVKTKTPAPFDTESRLLETRRDALRQELDELLPRPEMTDAQRLNLAQRNVERSIALLEERIAKRDIGPDGKKRAPVGSPALEALKARREALRAEFELLRDSLDPGRRERLELSTLKARLRAQEAHYAERLARGDFAPRPKREVRMDEEALRLKAQMEMAREKWRQALEVDRLRHRSVLHKVGHAVRETLNVPRAMLSSWDVSAVLRQGGFLALSHPVRAASSLGPMFRALASETRAAMVDQEILSRPNAPRYARAKLYLAPLETTRLSTMEEAFMSRVAKALPGVKASNRAFVTFLNKLRADSFDAMVDRFEARGPKLTDAELQAVANYVNVATGRGDMGRAAAAAETLATVFFSPRLVTSRFQLLAGQPMYRGSARTRLAVAGEYARFLGALAVVYALGNMAGADVEDDPRSSDFGKLKFGDTRVDPLGGLAQATVLLGRVGSGETKNAQGQVRPIRGDLPFGEQTTAEVLGRFMRSKLAPVVGGALDAMSGEDVIGDPVTAGSLAQRMVIPLSMQEIYEVMKAQGVAKGTALGVLSLFGMGLQQRPNADVEKVVGYVMGQANVPPSEAEKVRAVLRARFAADPSTPALARQLRQVEEVRYQTRQRMAQPTPRATP